MSCEKEWRRNQIPVTLCEIPFNIGHRNGGLQWCQPHWMTLAEPQDLFRQELHQIQTSRDMFISVRLMILMVNHDFPGPDTPINQLGFQTPRYEIGERRSKLTSPIKKSWIKLMSRRSILSFLDVSPPVQLPGTVPFFQIPGGWGFKAEVSVDDLGKLLHLCICCSSVAKPKHQFLTLFLVGDLCGTDS